MLDNGKATIDIAWGWGTDKRVKVTVPVLARVGVLALHKALKGDNGKVTARSQYYSIVHVPSGLCVHGSAIRLRKHAMQVMQQLADGLDWDQVSADGRSDSPFLSALSAALEQLGIR